MHKLKQRGKVIGLIIVRCPICENPMSFDRVEIKQCPYCNSEVRIEPDNVEISVNSRGQRN